MTTLQQQALGLRIIYGHRIPDGFSIERLDELAEISYGISDAIEQTLTDGIKSISLPNVTKNGELLLKETNFVTPSLVKESDLLMKGDLLFNWRNGSKDHLGKTALFNEDGVYTHVGFLLKIRCNEDLDPQFLYSYINYIKNRGYFLNAKIQVNNTFNKEELSEFPIIFPSIIIQKRFAAIFSSFDRAIKLLNTLIFTKQKYKADLTRRFINGSIKFKGHKEKWKQTTLGEFAKIKHGKNQHEIEDPKGQYPILGTGGIMSYTNKFLYNKPSVLIGRKGTIDKPRYMDTPFWTVDTLFYTELSNEVFPKWVYYLFQTIDWKNYSEASGVPSLSASTISRIPVLLPGKKEQEEMASVLSKIDQEIINLERQLRCVSVQKNEVMHQLLTGRTKLSQTKKVTNAK